MAESLNEWIENNNLKQLEENIAITINEVDDIDSAVRCIMVFVRQEFQLRSNLAKAKTEKDNSDYQKGIRDGIGLEKDFQRKLKNEDSGGLLPYL